MSDSQHQYAAVRAALESLTAWSAAGRSAVEAAIMERVGAALVRAHVNVVELKNPEGNGFRVSAPARLVSVMKATSSVVRFRDDISWPDPRPLRDAAEELHRLLGRQAEHFAPFQPEIAGLTGSRVEFSTQPVEWIYACVLAPLFWDYVSLLDDPRRDEPARLARMLNEAAAFLVSNDWCAEERIPVSGLLSDIAIEHEGISLRPATAEEMGEWCELPSDVRVHRGVRRTHGGVEQLPTHVLTLRHSCPKQKEARPQHGYREFLLSLQVLGFRPGSPGMVMQQVLPEWASRSTKYSPLDLPVECKPRPFGTADLVEAAALAQRIPLGAVGDPRRREEIALHRFVTALERERPVDVLLDSVVALEALLLADTSGELSYRFALRGACWLAQDIDTRTRLYKELHDLYVLRSKVVHGSKFPDRSHIVETAERATGLAQQMLLKGLRKGWPSGIELDQLALL